MASKSLGTLTIDLIAKVGGFVAGMEKAERSSGKWRKQIESDAKAVGSAISSVGVAAAGAAVAASAAGIALLKSTSDQITETDRWAKSLRVSTQELLAWQFAAEKAGVSGDQMADIFKDIGDKIGDAVLNKSGEAVDALNALGLSADKLSKTTPDKQLLAIGEALSKVSTNAGKITILESLGNDLSKLLPLFDNNNEKLKSFIQQAKDYGVAPDAKSINDLLKVNELFQDIDAQVKGLKIEIASGLAKVDLSQLNRSLSDVKNILTDPSVLQGLASLVSQIAGLAGWMAKAASEAGKLAVASGNRMAALGGNVDMSNIDQINERIEYLQRNLSGRNGFYSQGESFFGWLTGGDDSVKTLSEELKGLIDQREKLSKQKNAVNLPPTTQATTAPAGSFALGVNEVNGKPTVDAGAKKLEGAFKATEQSYLRQIALIDTTGKKTAEVTEQQKLQFDIADGKLEGLNATQRQRLEQLATEVDRLNAVKKANEDNLKVAEYVANLQRENANSAATLNADIVGAGMGDKTRDRMRERLAVEREFNEKRADLQLRYLTGEIRNQGEYDRYTGELEKAQAERLGNYESYYQQIDQLDADWVTGARDGLANWVDDATNYSSQAASAMQSAMSGITSNIVDMLNDNEASWNDWSVSVLKSIQTVLVNMAIANAVSSIGSLFSFGATAGGSTPSGSYASAAAGVKLNAKGGVYESADLSKFSNSIVNSPTMFAFAKGAGLMGEAGPEAIMPLTRAADGSLGVRALDSGQGQGGGLSVSIGDINFNSQTQQPASQGIASAAGRQLTDAILRTVNDEVSRPGTPLWRAIKGV
ncbi:phage tail tape measure protein [Enterobacter hormaechei]|uniref:phage tail tape measure protein n=1 Tax=Enterobacter hormaechei TaxID=158836 RepID=UPI00079823CB|nr:phage tail tape measure protein [Enterobacter hormaechei]MCU2427348.1 phage tail tape measure protein [Enterobacter hormaechei subsp. hoffmannii]ELC6402188.1 phage tail tape measure protein [Enterobacter hormaechei]ELT5711696.1 phage tail tape measure protein [Enterobacter hormaechei]ELY2097219.1 phage tail tape measure protein [Enterobacter hormaechei]MDX7101971.1 phage tail tape measure protein [Enterobacter hormaechei]